MRTRRFLLSLIAFPIPLRWLPAESYGAILAVMAYAVYLGATGIVIAHLGKVSGRP